MSIATPCIWGLPIYGYSLDTGVPYIEYALCSGTLYIWGYVLYSGASYVGVRPIQRRLPSNRLLYEYFRICKYSTTCPIMDIRAA